MSNISDLNYNIPQESPYRITNQQKNKKNSCEKKNMEKEERLHKFASLCSMHAFPKRIYHVLCRYALSMRRDDFTEPSESSSSSAAEEFCFIDMLRSPYLPLFSCDDAEPGFIVSRYIT